MHSAAVYGEWESVPVQWIQRSYLYSLPPIGIGTAAVESFTGYIARLAAAHAVEAGVLVNKSCCREFRIRRVHRLEGVPQSCPAIPSFSTPTH
jgi:hypothetical protein